MTLGNHVKALDQMIEISYSSKKKLDLHYDLC
jgi:hypothetical protein